MASRPPWSRPATSVLRRFPQPPPSLLGVAPLALAAQLSLGPRLGLALEPPAPEDIFSLSPAELAEIQVVSASLAPQSLAESPASVTLVTAAEIREMGARDLYGVLRHVPGLRVAVTNRGRPMISVRGVQRDTSSQLLFLLDGHVLNEPASGSASFLIELARLPIENIDRLEVVLGPGSAVYGSSAFLGVVNIITRAAAGFEGAELTWRTEFEDQGRITNEVNLLVGQAFAPDRSLHLNLNLVDGDGPSIPVAADIQGRPGEANSAFEQLDVQTVGKLGAFALKARYTRQDRGEYYGALYNLSQDDRFKLQGGFVELDGGLDLGQYRRLRLRAYYDQFGVESLIYNMPKGTISPSAPYSPFNETGRGGRLEMTTSKGGIELRASDTHFADHQITYGVLWEYQAQDDLGSYTNDIGSGEPVDPFVDVSESEPFSREANRTLIAPYIEDIWRVGATLTLNAGLRLDHYSDFGESLNPRLGLAWQFHPRYSLRALYGTAFRAPDFRSLYLESPFIDGNPDLSEERVRTIELGLSARPLARLSTGITLYHNRLDELINVPAGQSRIENIDSMTTRGIEFTARYQWPNGGHLMANYSYVDAKLDDGGAAPDEPRNSGSATAWTPLTARLSAGLSLYWQDTSPRAAEDARQDLPGYEVIDLKLALTLTKSAEMGLTVYNLLDRDYAYPAPAGTIADDYRAPGRSLLAQLRLAF